MHPSDDGPGLPTGPTEAPSSSPGGLPDRTRRRRIVTTSSRNAAGSVGSKPVSPDLDALVAAARSGDRAAFDELVRATYRDAYGLALRLTGDQEDARDVVQDAYIRAYRGLRRFRGQARFSTWLYRIVANTAATHLGRRGRHRHEALDPADEPVERRPGSDPVARAEALELAARLEEGIAALPPRLREVVVLRDVYELPHEDIARELGISVSAAKVRLHRARRRLRALLFPLPGEERADAV